jgi:hypothetical protein
MTIEERKKRIEEIREAWDATQVTYGLDGSAL